MPIRWDKVAVRINKLGRHFCEPGWHIAADWAQHHSDFDLWMVFKGRGRATVGERNLTLRPGVCLWTRPGQRYTAQQDDKDRLGVNAIHFELMHASGKRCNDERTFKAARIGALPPEVFELADVNFADAVMRHVVELVNQQGDAQRRTDSAAALLLKGLLMDIDEQTSRPIGAAPGGTDLHHRQMVMAAAARITQSPGEAPRIEQLAHQAGYSPAHFTRVFRQHMGMTPQAFLVRARIDRACQLLTESSLPIGRIADLLGYRDPYFFSRQFKQKMGRSPRQHRRPDAAF